MNDRQVDGAFDVKLIVTNTSLKSFPLSKRSLNSQRGGKAEAGFYMRVLIATVTAGGGHVAAAAAMNEAWRVCRPEDIVEQVDLVKFFSPLHRKLVSDGYVSLVAHAPELWGMMFDKTDNPEVARRLNRLKRLFPSKSRGLFARCITQFAPDVVLCTHYLPLETLSEMRRKQERKAAGRNGEADDARPSRRRRSRSDALSAAAATREALAAGIAASSQRPFVVSIVTDFEAHALWMDPCVDLYCVAAEETRARLIARGAAAQHVLASGIPISLKFSTTPNPSAVRKTLGVRDDLPLLLVLSGGFGMGPVAKIVAALDLVKQPFQAVVVTGKNEKLRRELATLDRRHPMTVLGYASNMHELMAAADLIVTKPGGLTSSEVLAMGKPIFIVNPIPGQEAANSDFLLERGAAGKANRVEDLPYRIEQLIGAKKLSEMAGAAKALGRPDAARVICQEVARRAEPPVEQKELGRMDK